MKKIKTESIYCNGGCYYLDKVDSYEFLCCKYDKGLDFSCDDKGCFSNFRRCPQCLKENKE